MSFIPHTEENIQEMLASLNITSIEDLFAEIPSNLQVKNITNFSDAMPEFQVQRLMQQRASKDQYKLNFIGAGSYEHHIPAAVWDIASRGEFLTAYTPYQAEASQGTLQLLYEYQTMMATLMDLPVANASLYDGGTALAEAILLAIRTHKRCKNKKILLPTTINPMYRRVVHTVVQTANVEIIEIPFVHATGKIAIDELEKVASDGLLAMVLPQPNFFGILEDVDAITDWAQRQGAFVIGVVNPLAMSLLRPPGQWGEHGADIACGDAQPFGIPMASGGPYIGFLCCQKEFLRQLPGRLVGVTTDQNGARGFTLTLQAREQHIRRSKATSNICTNQGLLATVATIYLSLMGPHGLQAVARKCHVNTLKLRDKLLTCPGISLAFPGPFFHEVVYKISGPLASIQQQLAQAGIQAGLNLSSYYALLQDHLLVCVTETKNDADIQQFSDELIKSLN